MITTLERNMFIVTRMAIADGKITKCTENRSQRTNDIRNWSERDLLHNVAPSVVVAPPDSN